MVFVDAGCWLIQLGLSPGFLRPRSFPRKDDRLLCLKLLFKVRWYHPACHCVTSHVWTFFLLLLKFLCLYVSSVYFLLVTIISPK